ncbi:hypothetical protein GH714_034781 [Hevea brasiliensis]|uniref:TF-B3 domain-containing protein n=1 Tax=Hevea brasiliensis TaxID=3981 RepID=A0A6A6N9A4_HEVBR|nr:hypothetical protein GH714_034781 [Hevea brasiliensis]
MKLLKRPNRTCFTNFGFEMPPDMPDEWWDKIRTKGGTDVKLVIMKQMFATDLNPHYIVCQFLLSRKEDSSFLTEDEKSKLKEQKENIPVTLMEPCGDESKILLRQWNLKSSSTYVLTSSWKKSWKGIIRDHHGNSNKNNIVQLWSFRTMENSGWHCLREGEIKMGRFLDADIGGYFDRIVAAIKSMNENKKRVSGKRCFQSGNSNEDEQKKKKLLKRPRPDRINFANFGLKTPTDMPEE